jgi:hypothetical protein
MYTDQCAAAVLTVTQGRPGADQRMRMLAHSAIAESRALSAPLYAGVSCLTSFT